MGSFEEKLTTTFLYAYLNGKFSRVFLTWPLSLFQFFCKVVFFRKYLLNIYHKCLTSGSETSCYNLKIFPAMFPTKLEKNCISTNTHLNFPKFKATSGVLLKESIENHYDYVVIFAPSIKVLTLSAWIVPQKTNSWYNFSYKAVWFETFFNAYQKIYFYIIVLLALTHFFSYVTILYPMKTPENREVLCFQGI